MNMEELEKRLKLEAFQYKMLLNARSLIIHLSNEGVPIEDFLSYMEQRMRVKEPKGIRVKQPPSTACPGCDKPMSLLEVNTTPATQTGSPDDKSVWLCSNSKCMNTIYSKQTILEIIAGGT